jgi:hypothetical protein
MSYRLVCLNGAIHAKALRQAHAGRSSGYSSADLLESSREFFRDETRAADDKAFFLKVRDAVASTLTPERFAARLEQLQGSTTRLIEADPDATVEVTARRYGLAETERGCVLKHLARGGDLSQWGLANAVTRASQDVSDYDRASELEALGGRIIELKGSDWNELAGTSASAPRRRRVAVPA